MMRRLLRPTMRAVAMPTACLSRLAPRLARPLATKPSTELIKELRARTSAPMKKCVEALKASEGDLEAAMDWLRKSGVATAAKKAGRGANEGAVAVASGDAGLVLVEINSETDFVARNDIFHVLAGGVAQTALSQVSGGGGGGPRELDAAALGALPVEQGAAAAAVPATEAISMAVSQLGENLVLRRACALPAPAAGGAVASYVHNAYAPGLGRTVAAVALRSQAEPAALQALGAKLSMHIVAAAPRYLGRDDVEPAALERERSIVTEQAAASGKPEKAQQKMVEGRLAKFYQETCLLEQQYLIEEKAGAVSKVLEKASKELGSEVALEGFLRFHVGEGIAAEAEGESA